MNILQISPHYVPAYRYGGPLQVAHSLSKSFIKLGHAVTVCTTNQLDETTDMDVEVDAPHDVDGVTVYYEPVRLLRYWGFSPEMARRISQEIINADIVLVHAHYQFANWIGAGIARRHKKPYVIFAHGSLHRRGIAHKNQLIKQIYLSVMEKKNIADALFVAFNAPEEMKSSLYHDKGKVIPNGIDPTIFASLPKPGDFLKNYPEMQGTRCFLFLGRLDIQQKGLDFLIPAFARLHREHPNTHLVLAGPDEDGGADTIRRLLNNLGLHSAVTITGLLAGQEKLAALQDADFFVLPSRFEGMSIALLEALYMGLPVLITDQVGLCRKIAEAGAGIVVFPDENSIYTGLYDLIKSEIGNQMREKGSELVLKNYTWDAIATDLINQIRESWDGTWLFT